MNEKTWIEWITELTAYMTGEKTWNIGGPWVCEKHPLMPYEAGYEFDCQCGAPGMAPWKFKSSTGE